MGFNKPCLDCQQLTNTGNRCVRCQEDYQLRQAYKPKPFRLHYSGDYRKRAKQVRDNAEVCWLCGNGYRFNDPWTADHVIASDPNSPLLPAHRSCNSRRGNRQPPPEHIGGGLKS